MPVNTPQLQEATFDLGASQQQAAAATAPMASGATAQQLPQGAGFVHKSGAAAYVANSIIDGWLKGRQIAAVKNMQQAQNELGSMKNIYDDQAQRYKAAVMQGGETSNEAVQAKKDAVVAWNNYNQVRQKYVTPDSGKDGGKGKKSGGDKFKGAMGNMFGKSGVTPHLFPQLALQATKDNPPNLSLSPQELLDAQQYKQSQTATKLGEAQLDDTTLRVKMEKEKAADDEKLKAIVSKPAIDRTPAEQQWVDGHERVQHINDPMQQQMADGILKKMQAGTALNEVERNFAYSQNLIKGPQSIQYQDGLNTYVAMQQPDGSITNRVKLGKVFHEDQAAVAARSQMLMHKLLVDEYKRSSPGVSDADAEKAILIEEARNPQVMAQFIGDNPIEAAKRQQSISKALKTVWANAGGLGADTATRTAAQTVMSNFISGDPKGAASYLLFRNQVADPTGKSGWWNRQNQYAGGLTQDKLSAYQASLWNQVRQTMQEQNPGMTPTEIDLAMPEWMKSPEGTAPAGGQPSTGAPGQPLASMPQAAPSVADQAVGSISPLGAFPGEAAAVGNILTAPARGAIAAGEYLLGKPGQQGEGQVKGKDGFYGTKTKNTKEYRVRTPEKGWIKYHLTDEDADKLRSQYEVVPIEMNGPAI